MEWSEVEVHTTNEAVEPVANVLTEFGAAGVSIEDVADFYVSAKINLEKFMRLDEKIIQKMASSLKLIS